MPPGAPDTERKAITMAVAKAKAATVTAETSTDVLPVAVDDLTPAEQAFYTDWADVAEVGGYEGTVWDEEAGPVVGFFAKATFGVGPNKSAMYDLDTPDGLVYVWGSTVLDARFADIPAGALVRLEYTGRHQGAEYEYKTYSVKFKAPGQQAIAVTRNDEAPY